MVSKTRMAELEDITSLEEYLNKNVKDEKESKELFSKEDIEIRTDISEEETSIIARLKFLCDEMKLENFRNALTYLMELRVSKNRKSRKEFIDSIKREPTQLGQFLGNNGGFSNGQR